MNIKILLNTVNLHYDKNNKLYINKINSFFILINLIGLIAFLFYFY